MFMKCKKHKTSITKWENNWYGGCGKCYIDSHSGAIMGEWSRNARTESMAHEKDILQPFRKDGTYNPSYVRAYGTKTLEKEYKVTKEEVLKNVERYG